MNADEANKIKATNRIEAEYVQAHCDVEKDTAYWEELATGQDTEEAEASGAIIGYRDGLRFALCELRNMTPAVAETLVPSWRIDAAIIEGRKETGGDVPTRDDLAVELGNIWRPVVIESVSA